MLSIARALMLNPALLLLDEPSEGLAPMIVEEIVDVLRGLKREGLAILLVEQNLRAAFAVGDRHHIMNKGEICFTGTSAEIESNEDRAAELSQCLRRARLFACIFRRKLCQECPTVFRAFAFAASACSLALGAAPTAADSVADFYKGKTVSLIIGYSAGGGADLWARFIARHLGGTFRAIRTSSFRTCRRQRAQRP